MIANRSVWLSGLAALIVIAPLVLPIQGEFSGADDQASQVIESSVPGYEPWFSSIWEPPSGEIESLLFALQAALGAGIIGYVVGRRHGKASAGNDGGTR